MLYLLSSYLCHAGTIGSTTNKINFNSDNTGNAEMSLTSTGLGVGTSPSANLHILGNAIISESLQLGNTASTSTLHISGSMGFTPQTVSSNVTLSDNSIILVDTSTGNLSISLPFAGNATGRIYDIKKISSNHDLWINGGGNYIDNQLSLSMSSNATVLPSVRLLSNGKQWYILDSNSTQNEIGSDNLIGWWKFDETSGNTAVDSSGSGNTGITQNMNDADWVNGKIGNALDLDGSNDYIDVGTGDAYAGPDMTAITISVWINIPADVTSDAMIFDKFWDGSDESYTLYIQNNTPDRLIWRLRTNVPNTANAFGTSTISTNTWHHVVGTWDSQSGSLILYLNGSVEGTSSLSGSYVNENTSSVWIGSAQYGGSGNRRFPGMIDDVRIYNRALTPDEINALYSAGSK